MLGAALTPVLWAIVGWGHIVFNMIMGNGIEWYEWAIVVGYTIGSSVYVWSQIRQG
ncbi:hypothetical protein [Vibrio sp. DNB22_19_1]